MMEEKNQDENNDHSPKEKKKGPLPLFDEEIKKILEKIKGHHDDLDHQLEQIYRASGLTPQKIIDYLENQENFTEVEWKRIQNLRKHFDNQLLKIIPNYEKEKKSKRQLKSKQKLRGKAIGKKKKWIEMD